MIHLEAGLKNPLEQWGVKCILKGINRLLGRPPKRKLPITIELMEKMYKKLDMCQGDDIAFWAAATTAFFAMLRKSTLVPKSTAPADTAKALSVGDIKECSKGVLLSIRHTKTLQSHDRVLRVPVPLVPTRSVCPTTAIRVMQAQPGYPVNNPQAPLFTFIKDGRPVPLTHSAFTTALRHVLDLCGVESENYSGHSFRRGGATYAFKRGITPLLIKAQGDWKSECYQAYVDTDLDQQWAMVEKLACM